MLSRALQFRGIAVSVLRPSAVLQTSESSLCKSMDLLKLGSNSLLGFDPKRTIVSNKRLPFRDYRKDFKIYRAPPIGPHKRLAPAERYRKKGPGPTGKYHYTVEFPEDRKYTIKKLTMTNLGGRCPETGRKIIAKRGKWYNRRKYRWIDWQRLPDDWPRDGPEFVEQVISVQYTPNRKCKLALTGYGERLRWQIATETMKPGDLIRTYWDIPAIPVRPKLGDSHPIGALPVGTVICLINPHQGEKDQYLLNKAGDGGSILRKIGDRVIVKYRDDLEYSFHESCQCVVGRISIHPLKEIHIGSPQRARWLGIHPSSGLYFPKVSGRHGRKIKKPPPVRIMEPELPKKNVTLTLNKWNVGRLGMPHGKKSKKISELPQFNVCLD